MGNQAATKGYREGMNQTAFYDRESVYIFRWKSICLKQSHFRHQPVVTTDLSIANSATPTDMAWHRQLQMFYLRQQLEFHRLSYNSTEHRRNKDKGK